MNMCFDELGLGVKSQSNSAMAGSCRNIPSYSLVCFIREVKYGFGMQVLLDTVLFPTQNLRTLERETGLRRKVVVQDPNKGDYG